MDGDGVHICLDKYNLERIVVDNTMMDKAKIAFMEKLENRRSNEKSAKEENKVIAEVIDFSMHIK